jgi:hypothetical protein
MKPDLYTKFILSVIAASLLWLCLEGTVHPPVVSAQEAQRVVIVGIENRAEDAISSALRTYKGVTATDKGVTATKRSYHNAQDRRPMGDARRSGRGITL